MTLGRVNEMVPSALQGAVLNKAKTEGISREETEVLSSESTSSAGCD